jgi:vitamin B12 transporter
MPVLPIDTDQVVITASRAPQEEVRTAASVTVLDHKRIERLGEPLVPALLRLVPSAAISTSGPAGSLTEVRMRGSEANHTLLFIDGIRANDPATGDQPRFDLLSADVASRIEVVRGPQSALWGSEAIGGVVAVNGLEDDTGYTAATEAGAHDFRRASASAALTFEGTSLAGALGWQRAAGIDSFDGHGDKDGYRNLSGRIRGTGALAPSVKLGIAVFGLSGRSEFDGFNPAPPFQHMDTLDSSRNRLAAGRVWGEFGQDSSPWKGTIGASLLGSSNRNFLAVDEINRTSGTRRTFNAQAEHRFSTGAIRNLLIAAIDAEHETFRARDTIYGGFSNQDRKRDHHAMTVEWRGEAKGLTVDAAVRRDVFSRFKDATSLRTSLLAQLGGGFAIAGSYAEGIAQPTFFDLYGFFPGSFVGNASLKPESSRGFEASLRFRRGRVQASLTSYRQRLHDEIVDVFDPITFLSSTINGEGTSRRSGVEGELGWQLRDSLRLTGNYAYLHASQPDDFAGGQLRELRRPRHSGSLALDGQEGRLSYGLSIAHVGAHLDRRDIAPFDVVRLGSYWLGGARVAFAVRPGMELFARAANAFDARYQDVFGYRTEGRSLYAGIRLASGR